jgi:hypothetical protein
VLNALQHFAEIVRRVPLSALLRVALPRGLHVGTIVIALMLWLTFAAFVILAR